MRFFKKQDKTTIYGAREAERPRIRVVDACDVCLAPARWKHNGVWVCSVGCAVVVGS